MARRGEGSDEILEGLWAMGVIGAMLTTMGTGVAIFVMLLPPAHEASFVGPGLLVPFGLAAVAAATMLGSATTIFADPGPQSGGPDPS